MINPMLVKTLAKTVIPTRSFVSVDNAGIIDQNGISINVYVIPHKVYNTVTKTYCWTEFVTKSGFINNTIKTIAFKIDPTNIQGLNLPHLDFVLSTSQENLDTWVTVKANVKEDFMKLHGINVEDISGVAIMTDTDNSKLKAISYYQNIYFSAE